MNAIFERKMAEFGHADQPVDPKLLDLLDVICQEKERLKRGL